MNELGHIIHREIAARGVISFARFMELSLYCPSHGYYERPSKQIGCHGDFLTSVQVGPLYGELLAFQFLKWLGNLEEGKSKAIEPSRRVSDPVSPKPGLRSPTRSCQLIEAGAHDGQLALDILNWLERRQPNTLLNFEYWILEPSPERQRWQESKLERFRSRVRWFPSWDARPTRSVNGIIFSNELLDAFPVHRIGWDKGTQRWFEWGVTWADERFRWQRIHQEAHAPTPPMPTCAFPDLPQELLAVLPDGFTTEVAPSATGDWWKQAARALRHGHLLTVDYGLSTDEFFMPGRAHGTLRAYTRHRLSADLLAAPGEQDITAHVNFTALRETGEAEGLSTSQLVSQTRFLTNIFEQFISEDEGLAAWPAARLRQLKTLTHPEHLGRPFQVLIQSRP